MVAVVLDKATGQSSTVATSDISISRPSTIRLNLSPTDISSTSRSGSDLIINLNNGEQIRIDGFYTGRGEERSELILEDDLGNTWAGEYTDALADMQFEPLGAVDQMVGAAAAGGGSGLGILGALGLIGAGIAAVGLGGGGGKDDDDGEEPGTPGPGAPTITLGDGDNFLNAEETAGGTVVVTIDLAGTGAVAGDTLTVNDTVITLTAEQIAAGSVEITLPAPGEGQTLTVTGSLTDADGNTSPLTTVSAVVDTIAPTAPTVTVGDGNAVIDGNEITDGEVTVRVDIADTGAVAGDTLTVNDEEIVLTEDDITAGFVNATVPAPGEGQTLTVTASLTDAAGNASPPATFTAVVDTTTPGAPTVTVGDGDAFINDSEITNGEVTVRVDIAGTGAAVGYTLTVNDEEIVLTEDDIAAGFITTTVSAPGEGQTLTVTATLADVAGNTSPPATFTAVVDTIAPTAPTVTVGDGNDVIDGSEVIDGEVTVRVNISGTGAVAGDTLTVNDEAIVLTADDIAAGFVNRNVTAPGEGQTLTVTASLTDAAGNASPPATFTAVVDTIAPSAPTVTVGDGDAFINDSEITNGEVTVRVDIAGTGAAAGYTLTVNDEEIVLTEDDIAAGFITTTVSAPGEGQTLTVTATLADVASNTSPPATFTAVVDTIAPTAPTVTVGDGNAFINDSEITDGEITVRVDIGGTGAAAGDTLTVNDEEIVLTADDITAGFVNATVPAPGEGQTLTVTTSLTDAAGNVSPPATFTAVVDTTAPGSPTITLGNGDNVILEGELQNGSVPIRIGLGGTNAATGDTLTINGVDRTLTADEIEDGFVDASVPALADGAELTVIASLTDAAGNNSGDASVSAVMNTGLLGAPVITLGDGDPYINASEVVGGTVTVSLNLAGTGADVGYTLTVNDEDITLTADDIAAGFVTTQVTAPANGGTLSVTATLDDNNGRTSQPITVSAPVDTSPPETPTFVVGNGDEFINASEITNGMVEVRVNLTNTGALPGDTLTVNNTAIVLTAEQIDAGEVVTSVQVPASGQTLSVHASLTDVAGNSSQITTVSFAVDTTPPGQPVLTVGNGDGYINADEITDGEIEVSISLANTGAAVGDILTVNDTQIPLTADMIGAGVVTTTVEAPAEGEELTVTASITDAAGNVSGSATFIAEVDTTPPGAPQVTVGNGDGFISAPEVSDGAVSVRVGLTGTNARPGDTLTVNGVTTIITQAHITADVIVTSVDVPPSGETLDVSVTITDVAGNVSPAINLPFLVDTDPLGLPVITIGDGDEFINAGEVVDNEVALSISIANTGAEAGDTLIVNGRPIELTQAQVDAGVVETSIEVPTDGSPLLVEATLNDAAGNISPVASASAIVDIDVPAIPGLIVGDGDLYINASEIVDGRVSVTVSIAGRGAQPGDSLIVNGTTIVLTEEQITAGQVETSVAAAANGQTLTVTAQLADVAGNLSPVASLDLLTDTAAPTLPVLTLGDGDGYINLSEVVDGAVTLRIDLATTGAVPGDTLTIDGDDIILSEDDIEAGYFETTIEVPTDGGPLQVTVSLTDIAGNTSPVAEVSATVDLVAPVAPAVTLGNGSGFIGIGDVTNGTIAVSINIGTADAGDTLTVNGQNFVLTQEQIDTGFFNTTVPAATDGQTVTVNASLTDVAGNSTSTPPVQATMDLTAPGLPLVTLGDGDGFINAAEAADGVDVRITLTNTGAQAGDILNISGQPPIELTEEMIADGLTVNIAAPADGATLSVDVTLTDRAGNTSPVATAEAVVDTAAPGVPGVYLGDGDATINTAELNPDGTVPVIITISDRDVKAGDRLTVNGTTTILTEDDIEAGFVELSLQTPGDGATLTVDATITDAAGNVSGIGTAIATINTGIPGAPALTIGTNGDGFITEAEIVGGNVTVRADLANTGAAIGDTLTIGDQTFVLTQDDLTAGFVTAVFGAPAEGETLNITGSLSSVGGNLSPTVTVSAVVDTIAPDPVGVTIGNGDGYIVATEISGGSVAVTITLNGTVAAGYTLNVNGTTRVLTAADIAAGNVQVSLSAPPNGQQLNVNASLSDLAGNTSQITPASALVDTTAPGLPVISIGNGDGFILPGEISGGNVTVTVSIAGTGAAIGDTLTVNDTPTLLTADHIGTGTVTIPITAPLDNATLNVTASLTDAAGNSSAIASASAIADLSVPTAPVVTLGNGDAFINAAEASGGRVAVSININGTGAAIGDRLSVNGTTIVLTADHISSGNVATTVAVPANGQTLTVTATITDTGGNISLPATVNALVDTTIPTAPTLSIGNGDGFIGIGEISSGSVSISVNLAGTGAAIGDRLQVNGTTIVLTQAQVNAGTVSTNILAPANGATLTVNATITDAAGNTSTIATANAVVDTVAPTAPVVTLGNGDAYINASEVTGGSVSVSISLTGTGAVPGDRLTVNGTTIVLTAAQVAAGVYATTVAVPASGSNLTVNASLTDAAGNTSTVASASAAVDTIPPPVPTVTFLNDTGTIGDGISTDGTIRVTGIEPGARWEYSTNGGTTWSLGSGTGFTLGAGSYNVQVRQTDVAGNTSTRTLGPVSIINLLAVDDATTIPLNITPSVVTQPRQTGAVGGILDLGLLGNAVNVALLAGQSPLRFSVAENTTQQISVKGGGAALAALNLLGEQNYDLMVYRVADGQNQAEKVYELRDWLVFNPGILGLLLPSWAGSTVALPQFQGGGTYYVVLANPGGLVNLQLLANMTIETTNNVVTDYRHVTGSVAGNVLTGDTTVAGTIVSSVDQVAVGTNGLVLHGDHGTLTIGRNGAYSYQADPLFRGVDGSEDVFTYTITSPDGSTSTAVLTITIDYPHGPQALMTASIEEVSTDDLFSIAMAMDDDALDPGTVHANTDNSDGTHAGAVDGHDDPAIPDEPAFDDLLLDQGGQEIDLSGLADLPQPDPSPVTETASTDMPPSVVLPETSDDLPIDPFPVGMSPEDQLHHVSVV